MATNLDSLSLNITASTSLAVKHIGELEKALTTLSQSLNALNVGNLNGLTSGLDALTQGMIRFKESGINKADFTRLAGGLEALSKVDTTNLVVMGTSISSFGSAINGLHFDSKATSGINSMANALTKLSAINTATLQANVPAVTASLDELIKKLNGLTALTVDIAPITKLISALARLGGADITSLPIKLEAISKAVLDMMKSFQNAPALSASVQSILNAISALNNTNVRTVGSTNQLGISFKKLLPTLNSSQKQFKGLVSVIGMFYARCFIAIRAIKLLWKSIESAMNIAETENYFESSFKVIAGKAVDDMGEAGTKSAEAFYNEFVETSNELSKQMTGFTVGKNGKLENTGAVSMGLNVRDVKQYQAQYAQLASSMNVASDYAVKMSNALTMIGADLASIRDEDFTSVWESMSSGVVGMSKAVDRFGINIRQQALQQELDNMGIDANIKKLGQQDKALLRTIVILKSSRQAWADLAGTIQSPANTLKVLTANLRQLGAMIGQVFTGFVQKAMTYINALVIALQRLVQYFMDIFHITLPDTTSKAMNGFEDLADSIYDAGDALDEAGGSVKKLKGQLLGIDELNNMTSKDDAGGGAGGIDGSATAELQKAFDAIFGEYQKKWNDAVAKMEHDAQDLANDIIKFVKEGDWKKLGETISSKLTTTLSNIPWENIYSRAKNFGKGVADFFNGLVTPELFYQIGRTIAGYLNTEFYAIGAFVENFDWKKAGISLASLVKGFVDEVDAYAIGKAIGGAIDGAFKLLINFLHETPWVAVGKKIGEFLKGLKWTNILADVVVAIGEALVALHKTLLGLIIADPLSGAIVSAIVGGLTLAKVMPIITQISTLMNSNATIMAFTKGIKPASGMMATAMNSSLGQAWTSLGGLGGILTTDIGTILSAGTALEGATAIGVGLAGAVVAGFIGYKVGDAIYRNLIEDTKWDAFGYDMYNEMRMEEHAQYIADEIYGSEVIWNNALSNVAENLNWDVLFQFEGQEAWSDMVGDIDALLTQISAHGVEITDTASAMDVLQQSSLGVSDASMRYVEILINQYDSLDNVSKALLANQYGFEQVALTEEETAKYNEALAREVPKVTEAFDKNTVASDGVLTSLQNQKTEIDANIEKLKEYISANGGSYEAVKQLYEAQQAQKQILQDTITELKNYQSQHGGNYQIAKQLYEAQKELNEATGKSKQSTSEATEGYNDLMTAFENSSLSSADFAGYMDALTTQDIPKAIDAIKDINKAVTNLSDDLPNLKDSFDDYFTAIGNGFKDVNEEKIPQFIEGFDNISQKTVNEVLPTMETSFDTTVNSIVASLDRITLWFTDDFMSVFSEDAILSNLGGLESGFTTVFQNVCKAIATQVNKLIDAINKSFDLTWDAMDFGGEQVFPAGKQKLLNISKIQGFASGGFVKSADLFMANENNVPELVGTIGGRTAVASGTEITGIRNAIYDVANDILNEMRSERNLNVNVGIDKKSIFRGMQDEARAYKKSTGKLAF